MTEQQVHADSANGASSMSLEDFDKKLAISSMIWRFSSFIEKVPLEEAEDFDSVREAARALEIYLAGMMKVAQSRVDRRYGDSVEDALEHAIDQWKGKGHELIYPFLLIAGEYRRQIEQATFLLDALREGPPDAEAVMDWAPAGGSHRPAHCPASESA